MENRQAEATEIKTQAAESTSHNVFVSWSGETSKTLAHLLRGWLPSVVQASDPFVSDSDIYAGARYLQVIAQQLQSCKIGILCVTAKNQESAWLNFEAGALSKTFERDFVIPIAFDLEKGQIKNPLGQFQAKYCTEEDMLAVVRSVNRSLGAPLNEQRLRIAFDMAWEKFESAVSDLRKIENDKEAIIPRKSEDMFAEIVEMMRDHSNAIAVLLERNSKVPGWSAQSDAANDAVRRISALYTDGDKLLSMASIVGLAPQFDNDDWKIIEASPFMLWYLTEYHHIRRPKKEQSDEDSGDGIPF